MNTTKQPSRTRSTCPFAHTTRKHNGLRDRKLIYHSREEAMQAINQINHGSVITREGLEPYQCKHADHWHIGRASKVNRLQDEWDLLQQTLRQIPKAAG